MVIIQKSGARVKAHRGQHPPSLCSLQVVPLRRIAHTVYTCHRLWALRFILCRHAPSLPTPYPHSIDPKRKPALTRNSPGKPAYWSITVGPSGEGDKRVVLVSVVEEAKP